MNEEARRYLFSYSPTDVEDQLTVPAD